MNIETNKAYIFQPLPPTPDGRFYGVSGPCFSDGSIVGVTKSDAEHIAKYCNDNPEFLVQDFIAYVRAMIEDDWHPGCGCRFESLFSNAVIICGKCSKHPAFNRREPEQEPESE